MDTDHPDRPIEVVIKLNGRDLGIAIANREREDLKNQKGFGNGRHGFIYRFDYPIPLNLIAEVTVEFLVNRAILPPGPLKITAVKELEVHQASACANQAASSPLLITTMGRSGGTMVMEKVGAHPNVILADVYPYETRILGYYTAAYRALISPSDHDNSLHPDDLVQSNLRLGFNPYFHAEQEWRYNTPEFMYDFFEVVAPGHISQAFFSLVSDYYARRSALAGKSPLYFIEKCGVDDPARYISRVIFPGTRELILLRHPRDVICSQMAFWGTDFRASLMGMATAAEAMMLIKQSVRQDTLFMRYEDIIETPESCGNEVARFLELPLPVDFSSEGRETIRSVHATTKSASASMGRWRQDLSDSQKADCSRILGEYEEFFGYSAC
ncbi:sulfotransferase [Nitrospirillum amazonense]|uniref:sulfotransferase n=1 Tax=Nitrospirillum amazonense TaxID=28077 RepID=UPI001644B503|nr:sulfotransferase [Nitrospirillum amazonense]